LGGGGIGWKDWEIHGGCESAHIAFDPKNPRYTYAGCYQGIIEEYDRETGATRNIQAWPALGLAEPSDQQKYRFNWNAPITASPHDGKTLYHGGNVVLKSRAHVVGDIHHQSLGIRKGAHFEGRSVQTHTATERQPEKAGKKPPRRASSTLEAVPTVEPAA